MAFSTACRVDVTKASYNASRLFARGCGPHVRVPVRHEVNLAPWGPEPERDEPGEPQGEEGGLPYHPRSVHITTAPRQRGRVHCTKEVSAVRPPPKSKWWMTSAHPRPSTQEGASALV